MSAPAGRHFLQIPGPTNVPDDVLLAMARPTIDHRGPEFADMAVRLLADLGAVFGTSGPVVVFPASGTGGWEAALVNLLDPGDRVLCYETGHFAALWARLAGRLGLEVETIGGDWRRPVDAATIADRLERDREHAIRAVMVVHNETSSGVMSSIPEVRSALDATGHPALLLVDAVSSLGSTEYRHDEWGVDVTVAGSQKGLMLPPGLGLNAVSEKALAASSEAGMPRSYWDWQPVIAANRQGSWPYTPPTNLLYGLVAALRLLQAEGLPAVHRRHRRHAAATRAAVEAWGLEIVCVDASAHSPTLTAVLAPEGHDADHIRSTILERFNMSLGTGLGQLAGRAFRIGHLGHLNDLSLAGTLAGVQMGLTLADVDVDPSGVTRALEVLQGG